MYLIILKTIFLLAVASASGKYIQDDDAPKLEWAKEYTFEATKSSLTSGLVQDMTIWRTSKRSRIDYNYGAVKSIVIKKKKRSLGTSYKIHPETTEDYQNELFCTKTKGSKESPIDLEDLLPTASNFEFNGKDILDIGAVDKFVFEGTDGPSESFKTYLWASLNKNGSWVPVKIEEFTYNTWLGKLSAHVLWNIFNYKDTVDPEVFKTDQYNCTEPEEDVITGYQNNNHADHIFAKFQINHNRQYKNESEREMRRKIFEDNLRMIKSHNLKKSTFKLGINKFSDKTTEELKRVKGLQRRKEGESGNIPFPYKKSELPKIAETLPKEFDLRMMGFVTPVRDQESCGSCWTFGTTSAVEGAIARSNGGRLLRLANQALIDCAWGYGVSGCDGGTDTGAYHWMMEYGLPTEEEYGLYANQDGFCRIENMTQLYPIKGFTDVTPYSVEALKIALVNHGPLSVSINVSPFLYAYTGGIFYDIYCDATILNHEVALVGYGEYEGDTYWIVKNSWGRDWGIDGYFHISTRDNSCGITAEPTYVVL